MIFVDYGFYTGTFKGVTSEVDFNRLSAKASAYLDLVTHDGIADTLPAPTLQKVKLAFCEVVDSYFLIEQGGGVASESNDGISVTYVAGLASGKGEGQRLREAVSLYLGGTGLVYRGVG